MWFSLIKYGAPVLAILGVVGALYYQNARIESLNQSLSEARRTISTQKDTITTIRQISEENHQRLQQFRNDVSKIRSRATKLEKTLSEHDLGQLAVEKPGLIEHRVNSGTIEVFKDIEDATRFSE